MMKYYIAGFVVCIALVLPAQAERLAVSNPGFDFRTYQPVEINNTSRIFVFTKV